MADITPAQAAPPPAFSRQPVHTGPLTALQFADRILDKSPAASRPKTTDRIVAGDPTTAVSGIATVAIASFDVLKAAQAMNRNLVVTHESTFWSDNDSLDRLEGDPLFQAKRDFIRAHNLVCLHLHDHWLDQTPSGIAVGMAKELGWKTTDPALTRFKLAPTTLLGLAQELSHKLNDRTMRIVGDPKLAVSSAVANWGNATQFPAVPLLNGPEDVLIVGYTHEWEAVEYAQDMVAAGKKKGLILLGEALSEQAGMKYCAEWLKSFITEVPVDFIPAAEPYWNPLDLESRSDGK